MSPSPAYTVNRHVPINDMAGTAYEINAQYVVVLNDDSSIRGGIRIKDVLAKLMSGHIKKNAEVGSVTNYTISKVSLSGPLSNAMHSVDLSYFAIVKDANPLIILDSAMITAFFTSLP
mmetsp:Transcript_8419/g.4548  ORF Transcript_8419/g.4548 Transcript_8419/m.4548 type:complete len:118 (+) Transcript_8419:509-862(+)|eukprot:CAMPEP_0201282082 /NCGR_PEP_ID=MMETSP1317-20130820/4771_1 /ASSEMBLY_ACC=CAM_ASM_000770 /TAXON_ID=187299 /ORGANISM="Undescribed Undescribed, Strain Undescribed" /LENGTH=117 /DNA_ID=CAMNT_0047593789 /DNA_START=940 /DNA_END=1293 /DNA_ORIENTATION=+